MNTTELNIATILSRSLDACPAATIRNVDYQQMRALLTRMDDLLTRSGLEAAFCERSLAYHQAHRRKTTMTPAEQQRFRQRSRAALRCQVLRTHLGDSLRRFSCALVSDTLLRDFCLVTPQTAPSKSQLERFAQWLPEPELRTLVHDLNKTASQPTASGTASLGLQDPVDLAVGYGDSTALPTPIHHPVDWLLIRDAVRTLILAILCIRRAGLYCRMRAPREFLRVINKYCMAYLQSTRAQTAAKHKAAASAAKPAKRPRKTPPTHKRSPARILRAMLRVLSLVETHARRHLARLERARASSTLSQAQADRITRRSTQVLEQLPQLRAQLKTRLLQGQAVAPDQKLLSLYLPTTQVLVRGKTGRLVEYGHTLWLVEQRQGLILEWRLDRTQAKDPELTDASLTGLAEIYAGQVHTFVTDRGCDSPAVREHLDRDAMRNAVASRSLRAYVVQRKDPLFRTLQRRRSQTEGRISILKSGPLRVAARARSDPARERALTWGVLTHNLWVLARLPVAAAQADAA